MDQGASKQVSPVIGHPGSKPDFIIVSSQFYEAFRAMFDPWKIEMERARKRLGQFSIQHARLRP